MKQSRGNILWIDDEVDHLKPHILLLKEKGYGITVSDNGSEGIELSRDNNYDLVLLDQFMPGLDGMETLRVIKENNPSIPVIMITKSEEEWLMDEAISEQISHFLIKPVNPNQIFMACKQVLENIKIRGEKTISGYLKEFQFDPKILNDYVSTLSGGQKNRLMLAKILANPKSCLILDEPTNDLDMNTLDLLEEILINYKGTLIIVSHDRDFLNQTVTRILAFQGDGQVIDCIGGYSDYLKLKKNSFKNKNFIKHDLNKFKKDNQSKISNNNKF